MKKKIKRVLPILFVIALLFPISASAYSKGYSFKITHSVTGGKNHDLANKATSTTVEGNTYWASGSTKADKANYTVTLTNGWFISYTVKDIKADGYRYNKSFGTVKKDTYAVSVVKSTGGSYGDYIEGSGTIKQ